MLVCLHLYFVFISLLTFISHKNTTRLAVACIPPFLNVLSTTYLPSYSSTIFASAHTPCIYVHSFHLSPVSSRSPFENKVHSMGSALTGRMDGTVRRDRITLKWHVTAMVLSGLSWYSHCKNCFVRSLWRTAGVQSRGQSSGFNDFVSMILFLDCGAAP